MKEPTVLDRDLLWEETELPSAVIALASAAHLRSQRAAGEVEQGWQVETERSIRVSMAAVRAGVEADHAYPRHGEVPWLLRRGTPALIEVPGEGQRLAAVVSAGRRRARLVGPGGTVVSVPTAHVVSSLTAAAERTERPAVDAAVADVRARDRTVAALVRERLRDVVLEGWWHLRPSSGSSFWWQCRRAGLGRRVAVFVAAHAAQYGFFLLSWLVLGRAVLGGRLGGTAVAAWVTLLVATVPARLLATKLESSIAIGAGRLLRQRLLHGTLRLEAEEVRREGAGQFLGRVLEAEAVEDLAIGGGLLGLVAAVELVMALAVLAAGPGPLLSGLLALWILLTVISAREYVRRRRAWTQERLALTHDLIEKMVGHRTRLVQQAPESWYEGEADHLAAYGRLGDAMDRRLTALLALSPRGWMIVALGGLGVRLATGASPATVVAAVGGTLLALAALSRLVLGLAQVADALVAWDQVRPLFEAAARPSLPLSTPGVSALRSAGPVQNRPTLVQADGVGFQYPGRDRAALNGCSLCIEPGERLLLEGPSGSGKSTLVSLLCGVRIPDTGRVTLGGADLTAVGQAVWRRRIVCSPQFHENYLLLGSLAFNVLLGRHWPPDASDLEDAHELCVELGLAPLIERMPSGLHQIVGETGWRLSHGEQSLVFLARALLQSAHLVLLDETFGALDPTSFARAVGTTLRRTPTLLVISQ